jgi:hypothetical protein
MLMSIGSTPFGTTPFGTWPVTPAGLRASTDRHFLAGLNSVVAFEYDANYLGTVTDDDGDRIEDWRAIEGFEAVPCRLIIRRPKDVEIGDRPAATLEWRVLLGREVPADRRNRLVYLDPSGGVARYGYVQGRVVDAHQMGHHWILDALEYPI